MSPVKEQLKRLLKLRRLWLLVGLPAAGLLYVLSHSFSGFAEFWARYVYSILSHILHALSNVVPFSLAEAVVVLLPAALIAMLVVGIVHIVRSPGERLYAFLRAFAVNPLAMLSVLLFVFMANCGVNYGRVSFAQVSGLEVRESSAKELQQLFFELLDAANTLRTEVAEDDDGVMVLSSSLRGSGETAVRAFSLLNQTYPTLTAGYGAPKTVLLSVGMSYLDITGVFFPFTMEANVNVDVVDYNIPFTMCHELTHLRGYMREDEANFVAYLACRGSGSVDFEYSGTMLAFVYSINALSRVDRDLANEVYAEMSDGVRRDLNANNAYWKAFETPVAEVSSQVNSAYIQANGDPDGVHSYGRMVDLLLAWRRAGHSVMPRKAR